MLGPIAKEHRREWPVTMLWYTRYAGHTIEEIIDRDLPWFEWMVRTFQLVTPQQAEYYHRRTGRTMPEGYIKNVEPYTWIEGDSDALYMDICSSGDLDGALLRYRGHQYELFSRFPL